MEDDELYEMEEGESGLVIVTEPIRVTDYSEHARNVLRAAENAATTAPGGVLTSEHLLLSMVADPDCTATRILANCGFTSELVSETIIFIGGAPPIQKPVDAVVRSPRVERVLASASVEAASRGAQRIDTLHLLFALIRERSGVAAVALETPGVGHEMVGAALSNALRTGMTDPS